MLVVFYGPSCVGKTSLQTELLKTFNWRLVRCFTTRPQRAQDAARVHITDVEYLRMATAGDFVFENFQFGHRYGTSLADITIALSSRREVFSLDYRIADWKQLSHFTHIRVLVTVANAADLERRIHIAGRQSRRPQILAEYEAHYTPKRLNYFRSLGFTLLYNAFGALDSTVQQIATFVKGLENASPNTRRT